MIIKIVLCVASYEGGVCSTRADCLNASADCRRLLSNIMESDGDLGNPEFVEFR